MGNPLPHIDLNEFRERLVDRTPDHASALLGPLPGPLSQILPELLWVHYQELRRWNPKLSLVGPGTADEIVERHYGESLAGLAHLRDTDRSLVDVGTGGGFPGLVLGVAAALQTAGVDDRSATEPFSIVLIEPRQRKWAFLQSAVRRMEQRYRDLYPDAAVPWSCRAVSARVDRPLPRDLDRILDEVRQRTRGLHVVTTRALAFTPDIWEPLLQTDPNLRFLLWAGVDQPSLPPSADIVRSSTMSDAATAGKAATGTIVSRRILEVIVR